MTDPTEPEQKNEKRIQPGQPTPAPPDLNASGLERIAIGDIRPHPENPRQGDVGAIHGSITELGWYGAIIVQRSTGHILAGSHRWLAAQDAGLSHVPVIWVDVGETTARKILLSDNRTSDRASYDNHALASLLKAMAEAGELAGSGYTGEDLDDLLDDLAGPPPADPEKGSGPKKALERWAPEVGQVWTAGRHRLMCGDSTDPEAVSRLLEDRLIRCVWTDPPYGVSYGEKQVFLNEVIHPYNRITDPIESDHSAPEEVRALIVAALEVAKAHAHPGASIYMAAPSNSILPTFIQALNESGFEYRHGLAWIKNQMVFGRADYHYKHEAILYGWLQNGAHYFKVQDGPATSIFEVDRPLKSPYHPTTKPTELIRRMIANSTKRSDAVYDPFMGSGSTILAAEQRGCTGYGMELTPIYMASALQRLEEAGLEPQPL